MRAAVFLVAALLLSVPVAAMDAQARVEEEGEGCATEGSREEATTEDAGNASRTTTRAWSQSCTWGTEVFTVEGDHDGHGFAAGVDAPATFEGSGSSSDRVEGSGCAEGDAPESCGVVRRSGESEATWTRDFVGLRVFAEADGAAADARFSECHGKGAASAEYEEDARREDVRENATCTSSAGVGATRVTFERCEHAYAAHRETRDGEERRTFAFDSTCWRGVDEVVAGERVRAGEQRSDAHRCDSPGDGCRSSRTRTLFLGSNQVERPHAIGS